MNSTPASPASRNYPLLLAGQFLGAFGDNFLLAAILGPLTYALSTGKITETVISSENALFSIVFSIPFIVLAPLAGFLNDRMPKTAWLVGGNLVKLAGTAVGFLGVSAFSGSSHAFQVAGYCIVGVGACVYSPAKYGILPEVVPVARLVKANGMVEMLTLVAIVGGLIGGVILYDYTLSLSACYFASMALYGAAFLSNAAMARTPCNPGASLSHSVAAFGSSFLVLVRSPRLGRILLGSALFWFAGSTLKSALQGWGLVVYAQAGITNVTNVKLVLLKIGMVVGIVAGSLLAGRLHKTGDLSWARRYALLMAVGFVGLGVLGGKFGLVPAIIVLTVTGAAAGLLVVPFNAALQSETDQAKLGKTVSIQNCTDYMGIAAGSLFLWFMSWFGLSPNQDLMALGVTVALITLGMRMLGTGRPAAPSPIAR
jgi:MFS transporter, LPLT family, lysophospholipid transporter